MQHAEVVLHRSFLVGPVPRRLFGSFVEHMGRCVYEGIYQPDHASADENGFRRDVLELAREMGVSLVRYPGGNFVSGYHWEDGVGPKSSRPVRIDRAWKALEPNQVGVDDFMGWVKQLGAEPMMAVNLGTRGVDAACQLLEYTNIRSGTAWSDLRAAHGWPEPHDVRLWCLGNEMDGPWQIGQLTAREYGRLASRTGRAMRKVDPGIELVACGSSGSTMPTFGAWEAEVLEEAYDVVDYISLHAYYELHDGDRASFLASAVDMDHMIDSVVSTADAVGARLGRRRRIGLSFDEWNVWYLSRFSEDGLTLDRPRALIEDDYSALDAVVVGSLLMSLLRHSDRVAVACQAQLVNVIAPIRTTADGPAWRQATYDPFRLTAQHATGEVLRAAVTSPRHHTDRFDEVSTVDAVATLDDDAGRLAVFLVNRSPDSSVPITVVLPTGRWGCTAHYLVEGADAGATNTSADPDAVRARTAPTPAVEEGRLTVTLPPASWCLLHLNDQPRHP